MRFNWRQLIVMLTCFSFFLSIIFFSVDKKKLSVVRGHEAHAPAQLLLRLYADPDVFALEFANSRF